MNEKTKYTYLGECKDFPLLMLHLAPEKLKLIEDILDAYNTGKVSLNIVRNENDEIIFDDSFDLIINDTTYLPMNPCLVSTVLKWYEGYDNTVDYVIDYVLEESSKDVEYDMNL